MFPLRNAVLLPRAVQPLHVFEERYRHMTRDALEGSRLIALALLKPGHEKRYHTMDVPIHEVVCVGNILREECLPDGRYNFLLQGVTRAKVIEENHDLPYRRARLEAISIGQLDPSDECRIRALLKAILERPPIAQLAACGDWLALAKCATTTLSDLVDYLASIVLQSCEEKQFFLRESRLCVRADFLVDVLKGTAAALANHAARSRRPRNWPPLTVDN